MLIILVSFNGWYCKRTDITCTICFKHSILSNIHDNDMYVMIDQKLFENLAQGIRGETSAFHRRLADDVYNSVKFVEGMGVGVISSFVVQKFRRHSDLKQSHQQQPHIPPSETAEHFLIG
jgi:hypothetical protein